MLLVAIPSLTPASVKTTVCALPTPVRVTITLLTLPVPDVTLAPCISNSSVFNCRAPCALRRIEDDHTAIQFPKLAENLMTPCATTNQTYLHEIYCVMCFFLDLNLQRCFQFYAHKSSDSCSGACVTMQAPGSIRTA